MQNQESCGRRGACPRWFAGPVALALAIATTAGPAFADGCAMSDLSAKAQALVTEGQALEKRNPAKYKEAEAQIGKMMDEDSKPPNDQDSAKICADYDKMIQTLKSAQ